MTVGEAIRDFRISKRTLERRIADGSISQTQIFTKDGKRFIPIAELIRAFGEPRNRPETETAEDAPATPAGDVTGGAGRAELVEELRERARRAEERADRYERERDELRTKYEAVLTRLLPPSAEPTPVKRSGWWRVFGRG